MLQGAGEGYFFDGKLYTSTALPGHWKTAKRRFSFLRQPSQMIRNMEPITVNWCSNLASVANADGPSAAVGPDATQNEDTDGTASIGRLLRPASNCYLGDSQDAPVAVF